MVRRGCAAFEQALSGAVFWTVSAVSGFGRWLQVHCYSHGCRCRTFRRVLRHVNMARCLASRQDDCWHPQRPCVCVWQCADRPRSLTNTWFTAGWYYDKCRRLHACSVRLPGQFCRGAKSTSGFTCVCTALHTDKGCRLQSFRTGIIGVYMYVRALPCCASADAIP